MPLKDELPIDGAGEVLADVGAQAKGDPKQDPPVKGDKMLAYAHADKVALQTLVARVDQVLGYPKIGKAATGCRNVGQGPHVPDSAVRTDTAAVVITDDVSGYFILATPDVQAQIASEKAASAARVQNGTPQAKDVEIAASTTLDKPGV